MTLLESDPCPGIYLHSKTGNLYQVGQRGVHSETAERLVAYRALATDLWWFRPISSFNETVILEGVERTRFELRLEWPSTSLLTLVEAQNMLWFAERLRACGIVATISQALAAKASSGDGIYSFLTILAETSGTPYDDVKSILIDMEAHGCVQVTDLYDDNVLISLSVMAKHCYLTVDALGKV